MRYFAAIVIGVLSGGLCYYMLTALPLVTPDGAQPAGDFTWALRDARALLAGQEPYAFTPSIWSIPYPLTAAILALPLVSLPDALAAAVFFGLSSALLAYGVTRDQAWWRLLIFVSFPYWLSLQVAQWSPLLLAVLYWPALAPVLVAKPNLGIAIGLSIRWRCTTVLGVVGIIVLSLLARPTWPFEWVAMLGPYSGRMPIAILPLGPLLVLALVAWRSAGARFLMLLAVVPQRMFYDQLLLWWLPRSRRQMLGLTLSSWAVYALYAYAPAYWEQWMLGGLYLPALLVVLRAAPGTIAQHRRTSVSGADRPLSSSHAIWRGIDITWIKTPFNQRGSAPRSARPRASPVRSPDARGPVRRCSRRQRRGPAARG